MTEHVRRPALRFNRELATQFGIDPDTPDPPRELVRVDEIPTPPPVAADAMAMRRTPTAAPAVDIESAVLHILAEEMDELAMRLDKYGIAFPSPARQQMVDTALALLGGAIAPSGTLAGR